MSTLEISEWQEMNRILPSQHIRNEFNRRQPIQKMEAKGSAGEGLQP